MCPLLPRARSYSNEPSWFMAQAFCASFSADQNSATAILSQAERRGIARGVDYRLAEKVVGSGPQSRRSVKIEWGGVARLTAWRFGLATAGGVTIPDALMATVRPHVCSWQALAPMLSARARIAPAETAALRGVLSSAAYADLFGAVDPNDDQATAELSIAHDLATASNAATADDRMTALKALWDEPKSADGQYARLILTAHASERIPANTNKADAARLIASMLAAGMDRTAQKWRDVVGSGSDAWAMLVLADPDRRERIPYSDVGGYAPSGDMATRKRQMLFAGLAGLGRMSQSDVDRGARNFDVKIGNANAWTRAIDLAALRHQPGTVVLLAAIGMQTPLWAGVSPEALYHITAALHVAGMDGTARMIAAEAIARL